MSQSPARVARRHDLPTLGLGGEIVAEAINESRRTMRGARGVEPVTVINVEQVNTVERGMGAMLTLDTPEGPRAFVLTPQDAAAAGATLTRIAGAARTGLFIPV